MVSASATCSSLVVVVVLLDDFDDIVIGDSAAVLDQDAPGARRGAALFDNDLRAGGRAPRTAALLAHGVGAAAGAVPVRVAALADDNLLLAGHGGGGAGAAASALCEGHEQPDNEQEACDAAEDYADDSAGGRAREVVVGGDQALDDHLARLEEWARGCWVGCCRQREKAVEGVGDVGDGRHGGHGVVARGRVSSEGDEKRAVLGQRVLVPSLGETAGRLLALAMGRRRRLTRQDGAARVDD